MEKLFGYLRLTRPANIVTAIADILAGIAISGYFGLIDATYSPVILLVLSTVGLYGGGVVMNDVFDAGLDATERPERPIPSGLISVTEAVTLGIAMLFFGVVVAFLVNNVSGFLALTIAIAALVYDKFGKHHAVLGPLNMGLCRGLNLLLGVSIMTTVLDQYWYFALVPVIYIAAITMISRGEVHGGNKSTLYGAVFLYAAAMIAILYTATEGEHLLATAVAIGLWALMVFKPLFQAVQKPEGKMIGRAVKAGVLGLILMNAAWACAFGHVPIALLIVSLLPLSILLAKAFAVT